MMPKSGFTMNRQMTPMTTGVAIMGIMRSPRATPMPRTARAKSSASRIPMTTCRLTVPNTCTAVLRMMVQKFGSSVTI